MELLEHDFGHALAVGGRVPGGLGDEDGVFLCFASEDVFQRVAHQVWDKLEVGDLYKEQQKERAFSRSCKGRGEGGYEATRT